MPMDQPHLVEPRVIAEFSDVVISRARGEIIDVPELTISSGTTALVGPNGSGKSTVLHMMAGMLTPERGTIRVGGKPPAASRADVAYVLQSQVTSPHMPVTAREVVALGRAPRVGMFGRFGADDHAAVRAAMERLEVSDIADRQISEMSGGQRQRVLVAQGIAQDADVLLLDEPVAGVDLASVATIARVIEDERSSGRTVVVATHDLSEASRYDAVVLMAGHPIAAGTASEVLTPEHLRRAYVGRLLDVGDLDFVVDDGAHHGHDDHVHHDEHGHDHHVHDHDGQADASS